MRNSFHDFSLLKNTGTFLCRVSTASKARARNKLYNYNLEVGL
jgi:hypothetical protein